jgi:hypothetical protein
MSVSRKPGRVLQGLSWEDLALIGIPAAIAIAVLLPASNPLPDARPLAPQLLAVVAAIRGRVGFDSRRIDRHPSQFAQPHRSRRLHHLLPAPPTPEYKWCAD